MTCGADIVTEARQWIGTPWHHQGRVKQVGVDCLGLIVGCARALEIPLQDVTNYGRLPDPIVARKELRRQLIQLQLCDVQPGDILYLRWLNSPQHFAIFTGDGLIHAYSKIRHTGEMGRVIEHRMSDRWWSMVMDIYRLKGLR